MFLATSELKKLKKNFYGLNDINIRGSSIDLAIDNTIKVPIIGKSINLFEKKLDTKDLFEEYELSKGYTLKPNSFFYASTVEKIEIPIEMCGIIFPKSSFARIGLTLPSSMFVNPGYKGHLPIIIHNHSPFDITIPPYFQVAQLLLSEIKGEALAYGTENKDKYHNENKLQNPKFDDIDEMMEWFNG